MLGIEIRTSGILKVGNMQYTTMDRCLLSFVRGIVHRFIYLDYTKKVQCCEV